MYVCILFKQAKRKVYGCFFRVLAALTPSVESTKVVLIA